MREDLESEGMFAYLRTGTIRRYLAHARLLGVLDGRRSHYHLLGPAAGLTLTPPTESTTGDCPLHTEVPVLPCNIRQCKKLAWNTVVIPENGSMSILALSLAPVFPGMDLEVNRL